MARGKPKKPQSDPDAKLVAHGATTGHEAELWRMADTLRGSMDAAEYKHVVLGLIFLKYISDAFEERHSRLDAERSEGADPEDPDEYRAGNIFWVPPANAALISIGKLLSGEENFMTEKFHPYLSLDLLLEDAPSSRIDLGTLPELARSMIGGNE